MIATGAASRRGHPHADQNAARGWSGDHPLADFRPACRSFAALPQPFECSVSTRNSNRIWVSVISTSTSVLSGSSLASASSSAASSSFQMSTSSWGMSIPFHTASGDCGAEVIALDEQLQPERHGVCAAPVLARSLGSDQGVAVLQVDGDGLVLAGSEVELGCDVAFFDDGLDLQRAVGVAFDVELARRREQAQRSQHCDQQHSGPHDPPPVVCRVSPSIARHNRPAG